MTNLGYVTCLHQKDTVWPEYAGPYLKSWVLILLVLVILVVLVRESPLLAGLLLSRQEKSKQLSLYHSMSYLSYIDSHIYCCQLIFWLSLQSLPSIYMLKFSQSPEEDNCIFYINVTLELGLGNAPLFLRPAISLLVDKKFTCGGK